MMRVKIRFLPYTLALILLLIVAVAGWFATDYLGNDARHNIIRESQASVLTLSVYVSSTLTNIEGAVKAVAGSPWIAPALMSKRDQDLEHANSALDRYNSALNASVSYLMTADGITVASSNRNDQDSFVGKSYRFRPYFQEAAKGQPGHYFAIGITSGKRGFYASYPVQNRLGNVLGVVTMKKDLDEIETFFSKYPFCFFISPDGIIFLSSAPAMVFKSLWPLDKAIRDQLIASRQFGNELFETSFFKKEIADGTEVTLKGKNYLVSRKVIDSDGWSIVLLTPTYRITNKKLIGILPTIFICFLIIVFSGVIYVMDRSKAAIRESEESRHLLLDAAGEGIFGVDTTGQVTFINPAALRMLGFAEEEMLGQKVHALIHHSHNDGSNYPVEDCPMYASYTKATNSHVTDEVLWRKDGSSFPVEYFSMPIIRDGETMGVVVTFRDITERRQAETTLHDSEAYLKTLMAAIQAGVMVIDVEKHTITDINMAAENLIGDKREAIIGKECHKYVCPAEKGKCPITDLNQIVDRSERVLINAIGEKIPILKTVVPLTIKGRKYLIESFIDISERKRMEEELKRLSVTDNLTQTYNRTKYREVIKTEIERTKRSSRPLSVAMFDIDHFKGVNDTYGHAVGDYVLKTLSQIAKKNIREIDYLIRWGGEEFIVIALDTELRGAEVMAEKIRKAIENYSFEKVGRLTVSFGVTQFKQDDTEDSFMKRADNALYQAKEKGRNRVEVAV
jgi:diguanylate cyclase (GGDEF)-like protein/PAS domain S-box-containing protein